MQGKKHNIKAMVKSPKEDLVAMHTREKEVWLGKPLSITREPKQDSHVIEAPFPHSYGNMLRLDKYCLKDLGPSPWLCLEVVQPSGSEVQKKDVRSLGHVPEQLPAPWPFIFFLFHIQPGFPHHLMLCLTTGPKQQEQLTPDGTSQVMDLKKPFLFVS